MPFRLWYYLVQVVFPLLFVTVFLGMALPDSVVTGAVYRPALIGLIVLGVVGGLLGIALAAGRLRMRCPFCGRYGAVGGSKSAGLWLDCNGCGLVHGAGPLRMWLVRDGAPVAGQPPRPSA